jgi:hypothetical protein
VNNEYQGIVGYSGSGTGLESLGTMNSVYSPTGVPASWRDQAIQKARLALKDQDVNLGVAFAERSQTAKLVGDTCLTLVEALRALHRRDFRAAGRALGIRPGKPKSESIPKRWLELQYGWKPLLSDVYGSVNALTNRPQSDWFVTAKATVREKYHGENIFTGTSTSAGYGIGNYVAQKGVNVRIDAVPTNSLLIEAARLGITNPAEIGWELVPFSFVVDWFLPVGSFLSSLDALLGYGQTYCSISTFSSSRISHRLVSNNWTTKSGSHTIFHTYMRSGSSHRERVSLVREALTTVPLPLLPRWKNPLSAAHMANGLSLLAQVFGR